MELWLFAIIVLLVVILYMQSERFAKINSEINAVKKRLDVLLEKKKEQSSADETKVSSTPVEAVKEGDTPVSVTEDTSPAWETEISDNKLETEELVYDEPSTEGEPSVYEEAPAMDYSLSTVEESSSDAEQMEELEKPVPVFAKKERKKINYEKFIGENLFGKIGILVLVVGIGLFVKYAIDKDWINETMRTILGFVAGSVLLFIAERVREKYRTFSSLLAGGAFAVFYLTVAIAFHYYHLFSQTAAFIILVFITLMMSVLAILYDRRELAIIALVGGFIAPFLVSSGNGSYIVLFTYITVLNLGMFGLSLYKKWAELPVISFVATYLIFLLYLFSADLVVEAGHLLVFASLFYFIFLLPVLTILKNEGRKLNRYLLSIIVANNFIYLFLGTLFLDRMYLPVKTNGLFTLFIAIVNLVLVIWLRRSRQDYRFLIYTMLGLVLTFVSITVPIQLDGNYITLFWASEMVLLLWLYIKSRIRVYESASLILIGLTLVSYLMDVKHQITELNVTDTIFMNSMFATSLFTGLATGAYALLIGKYRDSFEATRYLKYNPWNASMLVASVIILYYTFMIEFYHHLPAVTSYKTMQLFTSCCILALCYGLRKRFPIKDYRFLYIIGIGANVILYMACVWGESSLPTGLFPVLLPWVTTGIVIANLVYVGRLYLLHYEVATRFIVYLSVISTLLWLAIVRLSLHQLGLPDEYNAGFSIALAIAGFVQMSLGMRLHQKSLRIVSLCTLGLVLVKLILVDLWAMPTVGKIVVFIMLGAILLVLSFLYQKLKDVLFKDDDEQND
ncbi:DUF2339 domain-containing protein [Bacteroides sp.]